MSHLKVFGCTAYALVKTHSRKFDGKTEKYIFIGYSSESKAYKLYNPVSGKLTISRDVVFNEVASWDWGEVQAQQGISMDISSAPASSPARSPPHHPQAETLLQMKKRLQLLLNLEDQQESVSQIRNMRTITHPALLLYLLQILLAFMKL